jgi:DNA repair protein RecO (recombination protein O)
VSSEKAEAIVLRVVPFSETSSIVTLFTREFGKLSGLAKGARRPKGPFESALDLLARCRVVFLPKSSQALCLLTEAKLSRRFRPPGRDLSSLHAAYYVAELLGVLTDEHDVHVDLYDVAAETLDALAAGVESPKCVLRFELATLRILGHMPALAGCAECGEEVGQQKRVAFALDDGGVLCAKCRQGKRHIVMTSSPAIEVMRKFAKFGEKTGSDPSLWELTTVDRKYLGETRAVLNQYMNHLLGRKPRLQDYLGSWTSNRTAPEQESSS